MNQNKGKRKFDASAESDPKEKYGNQTLPVSVLPEDFDGIPMDGGQYLATVRASADSLPSYFFASNNPYAVSVEEEVTVEEEDSISHEGNDVPTDQWREAFVEKFSNMREALQNTPPPAFNPNSSASKANLPSIGDKNAWYHFIYRAKVSSLMDTTVSLPSNPNLSNIEASSSTQQIGEVSSFNNQEVVDSEMEDASKSSTQIETNPYLLIIDQQKAEEESEKMREEEEEEMFNRLKRKADDGEGKSDEGSKQGASETMSKEEKRRLKKQLKNEPRTLRFPSPSLMRRFDLETSLELLTHITEWIQTPNPISTDSIAQQPTSTSSSLPTTPDQSQPKTSTSNPTAISDFLSLWIFSLLSRMDRNLLSEDISILRELIRAIIESLKLFRMRQRVLNSKKKRTVGLGAEERIEGLKDGEKEKVEDPETGAWMIIAIVVGVWGQMDLWKDARDTLRKI